MLVGFDARFKLKILMHLAYGVDVDESDIYFEGIKEHLIFLTLHCHYPSYLSPPSKSRYFYPYFNSLRMEPKHLGAKQQK